MISLAEAFELIDTHISRVSPADETIPVNKAVNRLLVKDQNSKLDLPPFDRALCDGYVISDGDKSDNYKLRGEVLPGTTTRKRLTPGSAFQVAAGSALPSGSNCVIPTKNVEVDGETVKVLKMPGDCNISRKASDIKKGERVLTPGEIGAVEVGNLIACGITEIPVRRRLKIAIISTGDELVDTPDELEKGKVINVNGPMISALAEEYDVDVVQQKTVKDDLDLTTRAIKGACKKADIIVISGGISSGTSDFVPEALAKSGFEMHFNNVALKPGKNTLFAALNSCFAFGLPGNSVSAYIAFHLFVVRAINWLNGFMPDSPEVVEHDYYRLRLFRDFEREDAERVEYVPARVSAWPVNTDGDCEMEVEPVEYHGAGHLAALSEAIGFFVVPEGVHRIQAGEDVVFTTF
ncbi:MAG: molybdopterin molybdotransferase MoeA [Candidatus Sumerlaeia bacterium]